MVTLTSEERTNLADGSLPVKALLIEKGMALVDLAAALELPLPKCVVAVRHVHRWWLSDYTEAILLSRAAYDDGIAELMQARACNHMFLYCVPRKQKDKNRREYFRRMEVI